MEGCDHLLITVFIFQSLCILDRGGQVVRNKSSSITPLEYHPAYDCTRIAQKMREMRRHQKRERREAAARDAMAAKEASVLASPRNVMGRVRGTFVDRLRSPNAASDDMGSPLSDWQGAEVRGVTWQGQSSCSTQRQPA